jgi:hypothetical protein
MPLVKTKFKKNKKIKKSGKDQRTSKKNQIFFLKKRN